MKRLLRPHSEYFKGKASKATTKKIAAEAGVNEVTIFRNFKNKNNLVELTKDYYLQLLIGKLEEIFEFGEDEGIEEYLKISFFGILSLSEDDFSIIRVAMEEVREIPENQLLISQITDAILNKLEEFFKLKIEKGIIRQVNPKALAIMCFAYCSSQSYYGRYIIRILSLKQTIMQMI